MMGAFAQTIPILTSGLHIGRYQPEYEEAMVSNTYNLQATFEIIAPVTKSVQAYGSHWSILTCNIWVGDSPG